MESSVPKRVRGDSRSHLNSVAGVDDGQASHAPSIQEQGQPTFMFRLPFRGWVVYRRVKPSMTSW